MLKEKFPYYPLSGTGVGLDFHRDSEFVAVRRVDPAGPCLGKIRQGDIIIAVDGEEIWGERQLDPLVRGVPGTSVLLLVLPKEKAPEAHKNKATVEDCFEFLVERMEYHPRMQAEVAWYETRRFDLV
ncbi:hypothetical protein T484DRAFT_3156461 [Baffinella frigidus]|nr:hypothetical protein T484DRAFT_3156461 [Cryptophyta sp. CCMP2293]